MKYNDLPDELRDRLDDLLDDQQGEFEAVLEALDHWIDEGVRNERTRVARLVALRSEFENTTLRDTTIDRAIVDGGSASTTAPILEALGVPRAEVGCVDDRTRLFDRALVAGVAPEEMEE